MTNRAARTIQAGLSNKPSRKLANDTRIAHHRAHAVTAAGTGLAAALGAVETGLAAISRHEAVELPDAEGNLHAAHCAPVLAYEHEGPREPALLAQLSDAIAASTTAISHDEPVFIAHPGSGAAYEHRQRPEELSDAIHAALPGPVEFWESDGDGTRILEVLRSALVERGLTSAWLVGVESRIHGDRVWAINEHQPVQSGSAPGLIPAEAAAAVRLELGTSDDNAPAIAGWGSGERSSPDAERDRGAALSTAITNAVQQAGENANTFGVHLSDDVGDHAADREWWQCVQTVWPTRVDEDQRRAMELGMLDRVSVAHNEPQRQRPAATLGHVGAAGLPLQLGLAARRRLWRQRWQPHRLSAGPAPTLITEHPLTGGRHAVVVTA